MTEILQKCSIDLLRVFRISQINEGIIEILNKRLRTTLSAKSFEDCSIDYEYIFPSVDFLNLVFIESKILDPIVKNFFETLAIKAKLIDSSIDMEKLESKKPVNFKHVSGISYFNLKQNSNNNYHGTAEMARSTFLQNRLNLILDDFLPKFHNKDILNSQETE